MLSYQHSYHAGGPADVHKHACLAVLLAALTAKPRPLTYIESHAGRGLYDLAAPEAVKTGEAWAGVGAALANGALPADHPWVAAVAAARAGHGAAAYPGSPTIARRLLRPDDRLHLMELHPREHAALRLNLGGPGVHIHRRDGYEGVPALLPPIPRRGLVLIDPSYEIKTEYAAAADLALTVHRRWPEAVVLLWYPVLEAGRHGELLHRLHGAAGPVWRDEVTLKGSGLRMQGSGLVCLNPPFGAEERLRGTSSALFGV
jgi:23S rRNA (adenine2030-N6)-methyltransferase